MNHDITHCSGEYEELQHRCICEFRDTCKRYHAFLEWHTLGHETVVSHVNARPCIIENYKLYWKGETK